jgi:hypothetical protein
MFLLWITTNPWIVMPRHGIAILQALKTGSMQTLAEEPNLTKE